MDFPAQEDMFNEILDIASRVIAHPSKTVTPHDRHRAIILISFLSDDDGIVEYIYSQMTEEDFKLTKQIRKEVHDKEVAY